MGPVWPVPASGRASRCAVLVLGCSCGVVDCKSKRTGSGLAHSSVLVTVRVFLTVLGFPHFMSTYMSAVKTATGDMLWTDTVTSN